MRAMCAAIFLIGTFVTGAPGLTAQDQPRPVPGQQTPPPSRPLPAPTPPPDQVVQPIPPPRAPYLPTANPANIKLDLTITDTYTGTPVKKTVSMLILNGSNGMIRTSNRLATGAPVGLNIDAAAMIHQGGFITVRVTFEYTPALGSGPPAGGTSEQMAAVEYALAASGSRPILPTGSPRKMVSPAIAPRTRIWDWEMSAFPDDSCKADLTSSHEMPRHIPIA